MSICTQLIRPASVADASYVASNLQEADKQELDGLGHSNHIAAVTMSVLTSDHPITFCNPDGLVCGVAGVSRTDAHSGAIWMLTTNNIRPYPKLFLRKAREWVDSLHDYEMLHNIADPRNRLHMKLLSLLGFKRLGYKSVGPKNLTYVEFAKLTKPCV